MSASQWLHDVMEKSAAFIPHGHCYLWIPSLLWLHVVSDFLIGAAYVGISLVLYLLVRKIRLPFSPVFIAFGLFIGLCGITHFMNIWTVWNPDYWVDGWIKAATAAASVATAIGLVYVRPEVEEVVHAARLSEERRIRLESTNAELETLYLKLKEADELKTQFFANVSHELRTPLALILGPAEHLLEDPSLNLEQRRQLEGMRRNGRLLLKQVNDLLDVSKLEAGKMDIHYAHLDLKPWARRIASQFELAAEQRRIRFEIDTPSELHAQVDPDLMERVLLNLLSNAFKFTSPQGHVRMRLSRLGDMFTLSVADNGPGVPAGQRGVIFDRFRQADGGATREHGGTGLGLAIVKDFVALHGGRVVVGEADIGGAEFQVVVPVKAPSEAEVGAAPTQVAGTSPVSFDEVLQDQMPLAHAEPEEAGANVPANRPRVLVVEDNAEMRQFIAGLLGESYHVTTAGDGREGLAEAAALRPDLIVTDVMMPHMSGDQLLHALRAQPGLQSVPVVLLTARADEELKIALLQQGAQDYLNKPFSAQELRARVANWVAVKRAGDALRGELATTSADLEQLAGELASKHRQVLAAMEATEVAREQAEQANRIKAEFLALVSHELRTPLSTIDMNIQLLALRGGASQSPAAHIALDRLVRASSQMSTLVEGLLQYTRIESGGLILQWEQVDPVAICQDVVASHAASAQAEVRLRFVPPSHELPSFSSDPRLLRVVLGNMLANALKFTSQGSVSLGVESSGAEMIFFVEDTGIGIAEADLERIFQPFEQLEPVRRKSIPGVGLGLSIVKQVVEAMNGTIEVQSEREKGSRFIAHLPRQPLLNVAGEEQQDDSAKYSDR